MTDRGLQIGMCGTFDVENYGDLLLPLIAEAELSRRLGPVTLHRFSYFPKAPPDWPFAITPLSDLPAIAGALDGMMIGGGHVIRFDKNVAPGYGSPTPALHHPTGYWLTPALLALHHGCPVVWNAPGVWGDVPAWAEPLMHPAIGLSRYVAVRDEPSRRALAPFAGEAGVAVVPDTCFGIARLLDAERPSAACGRLPEAWRPTGPYLIVQATGGLEAFHRLVRRHPERFREHRLVVLPIGPILGDAALLVEGDLPDAVHLPEWPHPLQIAALIGGAAGVVGRSLHLAITALAFGVPVFRPSDATDGKYAILSGVDGVFPFAAGGELDADAFMDRLGRREAPPAVRDALAALDTHWDRIASIFAARERTDATRATLGLSWQSLPGSLEEESARRVAAIEALVAQREDARRHIDDQERAIAERDRQIAALHGVVAAEREARGAIAARDQQIAALQSQLAVSRAELATLHQHVAALCDSTSWRVTAPVRWIGRALRWQERTRARPLMKLQRIERQTLATQPYEWALVTDLLSPRGAASLVATYPCDNYKTVTGYDGEKGYEYEARALIHMGADAASCPDGLSEAWRQLACELLSPAYRAAMSRLTGRDLTTAPMEAYVCHYGPGAWLGPHVDLKEKIVTHVIYFNQTWSRDDGGCLTILRSSDMSDVFAEIPPIVGNASVLVRSEKSWHSVSRVVDGCRRSRRSMNVIFYRSGAISTMWPPGETPALHHYEPPGDEVGAR